MNNPKVDAIRKELEGLSRAERMKLGLMLIHGVQAQSQVPEVDLNRHSGKAHLPVDGLEWQRLQRLEWRP